MKHANYNSPKLIDIIIRAQYNTLDQVFNALKSVENPENGNLKSILSHDFVKESHKSMLYPFFTLIISSKLRLPEL